MKPLQLVGPARRLPVPYLGAAIFGRMAEEGAPVVIVLLALDRADSAWLGGLLVAAMTFPHVVTGPLAGHLRDRTGRPVTTTAAAAVVVAVAMAALAASTGRAGWLVPVVLALLAGCAGPLLLGGLSSLIGSLVAADGQRGAHALDSATYNIAGIAGPATGAAVSALISPAVALATLSGAALLGAVCTLALPAPTPNPRSGRASVMAGFRWIWRTPPLRTTTAMTTLAHGGLGGLPVAAPLLASELGAASSTGGLFLSAFAAGAAAGSLVMLSRASARLPPLPVMVGSLVLMAAALGLGVLAPSAVLGACWFAVAGFADGPLLTMTLHVRTVSSPPEVRTHVFMAGASLKLTFGAAGAAACGLLADAGGHALLTAAACVVAASALPALARGGHHAVRRGTRDTVEA